MSIGKVWTMTITFTILSTLFLSLHPTYFTSVEAQQAQFTVYDYKNDRSWSVSQPIDLEAYNNMKADPVSNTPACIHCIVDGALVSGADPDPKVNEARMQIGLEKALGTWPMLKPLADQLREISGSDDELFANLALQVVHQINYKSTNNIQYPMVTIRDGEGDCDNVATLAPALMKAGGLDSVVTVGVVSAGNCLDTARHAMAGVHLSEPPDDRSGFQNLNSDPRYPEYLDYHLERYYLAEATYSHDMPPPTRDDYAGYAASGRGFVGENPLHMEQHTDVVKAPDIQRQEVPNNMRVAYIS